ncbi:MAG: hypothetical protein NVSMB52_19760 [Chloroflexota bacterium]
MGIHGGSLLYFPNEGLTGLGSLRTPVINVIQHKANVTFYCSLAFAVQYNQRMLWPNATAHQWRHILVTKTRDPGRIQRAVDLQSGPCWTSFEQFRLSGVDGVREQLGPNQIGRLSVKGDEFVFMRSETFNNLYGLAQEIDRFSHQIHLIRQAVELLQQNRGSDVAIEHVSDLVAGFPQWTVQQPQTKQLIFDENEKFQTSDYQPEDLDFDRDPAGIRPTWSRG